MVYKKGGNKMKGKKCFRLPEDIGVIEGSRQESDQMNRLISNKQTDKDGNRI